MRKTPGLIAVKLDVSDDGALKVLSGDEECTVVSQFSWPNMGDGAWNRLGGNSVAKWKVSVEHSKSSAGEYTISCTGDFYNLERRVRLDGDRVVVQDKFTNTTRGDIAIAFDNIIKPSFTPKNFYFFGTPGNPPVSDVPQNDNTPINTTVFIAGVKHGLGILLEDDFYRLQATYSRSVNDVVVSNRSFGLPAGDSYTFEWTLIATSSNDYYEFINKARDILEVNFTLNGTAMFTYGGHGLNVTAPDDALIKLYDRLGLRLVLSPDVWLGGTSFYEASGNPGTHYDEQAYFDTLIKWRDRMKKIMPKAKVYAKLQTTFCGPFKKPGGPIPFIDSTIMEKDGTRQGDKDKRGVYNHYPAEGNSYYKYIRGLVDLAIVDRKACDGIYFDTFAYNYWSKYGRWTYDKWDNRSVDIDPKTWTISAKKADLCKLSESARYDLIKHIRDLGADVMVNHSILTKKMRSLKINSFNEYQKRSDLMLLHGTAPVTLGYYPGYKMRTTWKDESDLFDDVRKNLRVGVLTHGYWPTPKVDSDTIYKYMYPITPVKIGPGYVIGKERIVTLASGVYCLESGEEPMVWFFDSKGHVCDGNKDVITEDDGKIYVDVTVPKNGAAVIAAPPSLKECLGNEIGADAK